MKTFVSAALLSVLLTTGCVANRPQIVLDAVGPGSASTTTSLVDGALLVFSAPDPSAHFSGVPYHLYYTAYEINSADGTLLREVRNDSGGTIEGPAKVELPPGDYQVVARASGYGVVTLPVTIVAHHLTTVHLDGRTFDTNSSEFGPETTVRLPNGQIVGWRAQSRETTKH
jgi:hypothetical protein